MKSKIERALQIISAMRVDGDNQELAVAAKNELKAALAEIEKAKHEYKTERITRDENC